MKPAFLGVATLLSVLSCAGSLRACVSIQPLDPTGALSTNPLVVQQTIATLRDAGPAGLRTLLAYYDQSPNPQLIPAIDAVAGQHDAMSSRLYWYDDLQKAEAAASAAHKPILYLRLLGKLTDEYSCANSRFFRTVLYANADVSKFLRENFIMVWCSERPVPVVTIDYGDGRVIKRTLTGNSIHYVLTSSGQVIDALPGLYDPKTFLAILGNAARLGSSRSVDAATAETYLRQSDEALRIAWQADARQVEPKQALRQVQAGPAGAAPKNPDARAAMRVAVSKSKVRSPLLARITAAPELSIESADDAIWQKIAALHLADATLDASSIALIRSQNPAGYREAGVLERTVEKLQQSIAMDTVHNNYQLRRRILSWLSASPGQVDVNELNRRVYAELFLTPASDPWLGMLPEATYTGLNADGVDLVCRRAPGFGN
jgi:hypothetical protein